MYPSVSSQQSYRHQTARLQDLPYQAGFEPPKFVQGTYDDTPSNNAIDNQGNWLVENGNTAITTTFIGGRVFEGIQSLEV